MITFVFCGTTFQEILMNRLRWSVDKETGCWNVVSHKKPKCRDYPVIGLLGKKYSTHRAMYMAINGAISDGAISDGLIIRHSCDNGMCVNPHHLLMGTKKDNTQDMLERNRESRWKGGRTNHRSDKRRKLSLKQVKEIKNSSFSSYKLAEIYPVSDVQIRRIRNGARCQHLGGGVLISKGTPSS